MDLWIFFIPKPDYMNDYPGDILLVGINYDKEGKEHQCLIEKYEK